MSRRWNLSALLGALLLLSPAAQAAEADPISFKGAAALKLLPDGAVTTVQNDTATERRVRVTMDLDPGADQGVSFEPLDVVLPPAGSLSLALRIEDPDAVKSVKGSLVAVDLTTGFVARQDFTIEPPKASEATPAVKSVADRIVVRPGTTHADDILPLPLEAGTCKDIDDIELAGPDDYATLTATCTSNDSMLTLKATGMDKWSAGEYTGTFKVGDTDVTVTLNRSAPVWVFLICLLLGFVASLATRSQAARWSAQQLRTKLEKLAHEEPANPFSWANDSAAYTSLLTATKASVDAMQTAMNDAGRNGKDWYISWLLLPPAESGRVVTEQQKAHDEARATLHDWKKVTGMSIDLNSAAAPPRRIDRAAKIKQGEAEAFADPDTQEPRTGLKGLQALVDEIAALATDAKTWRKLEEVQKQVAAKEPAGGSDVDASLRRVWIRCHIEGQAIAEAIARQGATPQRSEELAARLAALELEVDRLSARTQDARHLSEQVEQEARYLAALSNSEFRTIAVRAPVTTDLPPITRVLRAAQRLLTRSARGGGALVATLIAIFVVTLVSLKALYLGENWGTVFDMLGTVAAAAGGTLILTPVLDMVDQISGAKSANSAS